MNPLSIPPILGALLFLFLGVFVYSQNRKSKVNFTFLLVCVTTFWWQSSWFFLFNTQSETLAGILVRIGHIGIILLPVTFMHFIISFLEKTDKFNRRILYLCYFVAILFEASLFATNYFISGYYDYFWGFYPKANFLHLFFLLFIGIILTRGVYLLTASLKKEPKRSLKRSQIEYILAGIIFYAFASSDFIVNYGFEFYPIGFIPILFFLGTIGYAIAKYQLMNIRVFLTEFLVGAIAFLLLAQIFAAKTSFEYIWRGGLFLLFAFFGYLLIKSVLAEIKYKEQLQKAYENLKVLDKAKSEFISMASHQLRTPLSAIKGYMSMLVDGSYGKIPAKAKEKMQNVFDSNERLIRIINDLLDISKIEMGKMELEAQPTQLEDLLQSCYEEMKISADRKKLKLIFEKPKFTLPKIGLDPLKFRQIILNLIDNAIRYTQKGEIEMKIEKAGQAVRVLIKDTGEGLTSEEQRSLFQGFTRGSAGIAHFIEGAGLGLYTAKKFLELHKGRIWAESEGKGKGSTFIVELPMR